MARFRPKASLTMYRTLLSFVGGSTSDPTLELDFRCFFLFFLLLPLLPPPAEVLLQIKVATACDSPQFTPAQRGEVLFNVRGCPGIMGHLVRPVVTEAQGLVVDPVLPQPCKAIPTPTLILIRGVLWVGEILEFQKLEVPRAKKKVGRVYLVAKRLSNLANAERNPLLKGFDNLGKIYARNLRDLWPQVYRVVVLYGFRWSNRCSEEHVEVLDAARERFLCWAAARGAVYIVVQEGRMYSLDILATVSEGNDATSSSNLSALERSWHIRHSASGSMNIDVPSGFPHIWVQDN